MRTDVINVLSKPIRLNAVKTFLSLARKIPRNLYEASKSCPTSAFNFTESAIVQTA
jgi:hypothetical protein